MIPGVSCLNCVLWELIPGLGNRDRRVGDCRAHAPVLAASTQGKMRSKWPMTGEDDWCGDHTVATESGS